MEQFRVSIPKEKRQNGWLYDADSGLCMGLGSHEMIEKYGYNTVFNQSISGCPHKLTIHHGP